MSKRKFSRKKALRKVNAAIKKMNNLNDAGYGCGQIAAIINELNSLKRKYLDNPVYKG